MLRKSFIVVEAHDFVHARCAYEIRDRLLKTHSVSVISSQGRTRADLPVNIPISTKCKLAVMDDRRPETMEWVIRIPSNL